VARSLEDIESEIKNLPSAKLKQFREWYLKFDSKLWDDKIDKDIASSKLDSIAEAAIADYNLGQSKPL
jgi:hypothetical protein